MDGNHYNNNNNGSGDVNKIDVGDNYDIDADHNRNDIGKNEDR